MAARRHNFQTLSWFYDLHKRDLLDLSPPYQRRSVWNQSFKDYFVDTVLLGYPSPAIFLFEEINENGRSTYHVVDGKQRLTTLFEFVTDVFPVADKSSVARFKGKYFTALDPEAKKNAWSYQFLVEYVPTDDEAIIDAIFDRLNRNVAKLSPQELRHAKYDGIFIKSSEELTEFLPKTFPKIAAQSRRQMKDVEFVSILLLLLEEGPKGYSQSDLDKAFSDRDDEWDNRDQIVARLREAITYVQTLLSDEHADALINSRMRNQADFYSLVGAIDSLAVTKTLPPAAVAVTRLVDFAEKVEEATQRAKEPRLKEYFDAARSASNDRGPRETRIEIIKNVMLGA